MFLYFFAVWFLRISPVVVQSKSCLDDSDCPSRTSQSCDLPSNKCVPFVARNNPFENMCTISSCSFLNSGYSCSQCKIKNNDAERFIDLSYCDKDSRDPNNQQNLLKEINTVADPTGMLWLGCVPNAIIKGNQKFASSCHNDMNGYCKVYFSDAVSYGFSPTLLCKCNGKRFSVDFPAACTASSSTYHVNYDGKRISMSC